MADLSGLNDSFDHNLFADMLDETIPMLNDENEDEDIFDPNVATPSPTPSGNGKLGENWVEETPRVEMGKAEVHGLVFAYDLPSVATSDPTAPTQPYNLDLGRISTEMDPIIENILRRTEELVPNSAESSPRAVNFMDVLAVTDDSQVTDKMEVAINQYRSTEPNAEVVDVYEFVPSQLAAPTSTKGKRKKKSSKVPLLVKKSLKWSVVPRKAKGSRKTNGQISAQPKIERRKIIAENKEESTKKVKAEEAGPLKVKVAVNSSKVEKKPIVKQEPNGDPEVSSSRRRKTTAGNLQSGKMIKKEMSEKLKAKEKPTKSEESGDNSIMETDSDAPLINYTKSVDIKKSAKKPIKEEIPKVRKSFKPPKSEEITPGKRETENISNALLNHRRKTLSNKSNSWPLKKLKGEVEQKNMKFVRAKETKEENIDPDTPSILLCSKLDKDHLRKVKKVTLTTMINIQSANPR